MSLTGLFPIDRWNSTSRSVLHELPEEEYRLLSAHMTEKRYSRGESLFREGAMPSGIFFVKQGKVKKYKVDGEGKEQIIYVANPGELVGYHAILAEERYPDSAAALEQSSIAFIPREDFLAALQQSPLLTQRLLKTLSHEFTVLANGISVFARRSVKERLAITLIVLRERFKEGIGASEAIIINISRDDLANMVGAAKENVVRLLKELKADGTIATQGRKIWINDLQQLIRIANYK